MSFDTRTLVAWPTRSRDSLPTATRRARAVRACASLARFSLSGPDAWRREARRSLLEVGRMLVAVLDERPRPSHDASAWASSASEDDTFGQETGDAIPAASEPALGGDTEWAAWL